MKIGQVERAWAAEALRPAVGWKVWRVEHDPERTRLRSVLYGDLWPTREPLRASAAASCGRLTRRRSLGVSAVSTRVASWRRGSTT